MQLYVCKYTDSWSLLSLVEHVVPPGLFSLNWHYCHAACGYAVCWAKQVSTDMQGSYVHRGTVATNVCKRVCNLHVTCLYMQIHAWWLTCILATWVLSYMHVQAVAMYLHVLGTVPFSPSLSLFSSLNGKRLSAISFCQQLGDAFLQLTAICFNYVY